MNLDNWFYCIPIVFFGFLLLASIVRIKKNIKIYGKNYLPVIVVSLYFLSAILIVFVDPQTWYPYFHEESYTAENFIIYSIYLFIYLYPSLYLRPLPKKIVIPNNKMLSWIIVIMIFLGFFSFLYQLPFALKGLVIGAANLRDQLNNDGLFLMPSSPLTTLAVGVSYFYLFYIALYFIATIQKKHFIIRIGLMVSSLSYIVSGLVFTTRDVFIFYVLGFVYLYLYFYNLLPKKFARKSKKRYAFFGIILILGVAYFSYQRFSHREGSDALAYGTIGYIAQQPFVFSETLEKQMVFYGGNLRFPVFVSIFQPEQEVNRTAHYEWSFGTFVKDLYSTGGFLFLIISTLIFFTFFIFEIRRSKKNGFLRNLIVNLFYYQFITMGVFYFKMGSRPGNIYMIIIFLIYTFTLFSSKRRKRE